MTFKITEDCLACGVCTDECPSGAIKGVTIFYTIDQETCTECGTCVTSCPNSAIVEE
jgi:ferredoxin